MKNIINNVNKENLMIAAGFAVSAACIYGSFKIALSAEKRYEKIMAKKAEKNK